MKNAFRDDARQATGAAKNYDLLKQWKRFKTSHKNEADCWEKLYEVLMVTGLIRCKRCYSANISRQYGSREGHCKNCRDKIRITAGTFFHGIRSAKPWVAAIFLKSSGATFNTAELKRLVGGAYSSSWNMLKKIRLYRHLVLIRLEWRQVGD